MMQEKSAWQQTTFTTTLFHIILLVLYAISFGPLHLFLSYHLNNIEVKLSQTFLEFDSKYKIRTHAF